MSERLFNLDKDGLNQLLARCAGVVKNCLEEGDMYLVMLVGAKPHELGIAFNSYGRSNINKTLAVAALRKLAQDIEEHDLILDATVMQVRTDPRS